MTGEPQPCMLRWLLSANLNVEPACAAQRLGSTSRYRQWPQLSRVVLRTPRASCGHVWFKALGKKFMLKESKKSVRLFFAIISFLYFVMGAGAVSQLIIFIHDNPGAHLAPLFLTQTAFRIFIALAFGYVALKFSHLITDKPKTIKGILHFNFWGPFVFMLIFLL